MFAHWPMYHAMFLNSLLHVPLILLFLPPLVFLTKKQSAMSGTESEVVWIRQNVAYTTPTCRSRVRSGVNSMQECSLAMFQKVLIILTE